MSLSTKAIKNRIKSVQNTKKITKAMEMVAASKMRKAVETALGTREYAELALELLINISRNNFVNHPLLRTEKQASKILIILIASNKGLCGGFNASIFKEVKRYCESHKDCEIEFAVVGKKAEGFVRKLNKKAIASFIEFSDNLQTEEIRGLSKLAISEFTEKNYDKIMIAYTNFVSNINYQPQIRRALPISPENIEEMLSNLGKDEISQHKKTPQKNMAQYLFEPSEEAILDTVLPALAEVQIFQSLLESNASEHSARMVAMKSASDSAEEMLDELVLSFNKARQAGITQEIAEVAAGSVV